MTPHIGSRLLFVIFLADTGRIKRCVIIQQKQQQQPFNGHLSGTTRVGLYQKKHSPAHSFKVNSFKALKAILVTYVMFQ